MRRMWSVVVILGMLLGPGAARAQEAGTPDGRARVKAKGTFTGSYGRLELEGNIGAFHFKTAIEGDAAPQNGDPYLRIENVPMYGGIGTRGAEREETFGPPTASAALGTGGLTASFTKMGVLSNLSWPGPGFYEHVDYVQTTRGWPNRGAPENAGSFAGMLVPGKKGTWFTPVEGWKVVSQSYEGASSGVLRTVLQRKRVTVTIRDVVHPKMDLLARHFEIDGAPSGARLAYLANMNPTTSRTPRVPSTTDGALDNVSDFGTVFDAEGAAMLHFRPLTIDPAAATTAATGRLSTEDAADSLDRTFGEGVYIAIAGNEAPESFQAGLEAGGLIRNEAEGTPLLDPYYDAVDGDLSGSPVAFGKTSGAQAWDTTQGTVYIGARSTASAAVEDVVKARAMGFDRIRAAAEADWHRWLSRARLPASPDHRTQAVAMRSLMLIRTAQDRNTGAIVANTTVQTPYRQDWLRDGAFFNYALLAAGYPGMVRRHNDFYKRAQSETGTWDPILCTDGAHCSFVFPFEIDAQAFAVWSLWLEYEFNHNERRLKQNYEALRKGADVLWACRDPSTGLQCYASEDDTAYPSQKSQGAATVYLGLVSAARAAKVLGDDPNHDRWMERAKELRTAARDRLCSERCGPGRGAAYMVWPSKLLVEPRPTRSLQPTLNGFAEQLRDRVRLKAPKPEGFFQYPMEPIMPLAFAWKPSVDDERLLEDAIRWLTHRVAAPGVLHYGERIFHLGSGRYLHTIGVPHIWSGAELYLAAVFVHGLLRCGADRVGDIRCVH